MALCFRSTGDTLPADGGTSPHSTPVSPAIRLGIDSFSFHRWFGEANQWELPLDARWTTHDLLAHAATLGIEVLSLQTVHVDARTSADLSIRRELESAGVECILAWGHRKGLEDGRSDGLRDALASMEDASARVWRRATFAT